jgi:hypothetical protein
MQNLARSLMWIIVAGAASLLAGCGDGAGDADRLIGNWIEVRTERMEALDRDEIVGFGRDGEFISQRQQGTSVRNEVGRWAPLEPGRIEIGLGGVVRPFEVRFEGDVLHLIDTTGHSAPATLHRHDSPLKQPTQQAPRSGRPW